MPWLKARPQDWIGWVILLTDVLDELEEGTNPMATPEPRLDWLGRPWQSGTQVWDEQEAEEAETTADVEPRFDWLGNPLPRKSDVLDELEDSVDPMAGRKPLPNAIQEKGPRPKSDPSVLPPAATTLSPNLDQLAAPAPLALPDQPAQVRPEELRPITLTQAVELMEVNNPFLEAVKIQVEEAQSKLRAAISAWYPQLTFTTSQLKFPGRSWGTSYQNFNKPKDAKNQEKKAEDPSLKLDQYGEWWGTTQTFGASANLNFDWKLIDPKRVPDIAAARDEFEKAKNNYLISLRDLRLQTAEIYFNLQKADSNVEVGKTSVQASSVNLRDTRARLQAGVATKLDVLQAETQLARDQELLTRYLRDQSVRQANLRKITNLPQNVVPSASDKNDVRGVWMPSLQESIVGAYTYREELDNIILDISIANSRANSFLGDVQPFLSIAGDASWAKQFGQTGVRTDSVNMGMVRENLDQSVYMGVTWKIFDGGRAAALSREQKQKAKESQYRFAEERNRLRDLVETYFADLQANARSLITSSREVLSSREAYRLAVLRYQAGVDSQRNVIDNQRDVTQAETDYNNRIADYNIALAQLRRATGLDQIVTCPAVDLPASPPPESDLIKIPVTSPPLNTPCDVQRATFVPPAD